MRWALPATARCGRRFSGRHPPPQRLVEQTLDGPQCLLGVLGALLNDVLDVEVEFGPLLGRQLLGGRDHDRHRRVLLAPAQFLEELETVHLGHHEVEQDDLRLGLGEPIEGDASVLGLEDRDAGVLERSNQQLAGGRIVVDDEGARGRRLAGASDGLWRSTGLVR